MRQARERGRSPDRHLSAAVPSESTKSKIGGIDLDLVLGLSMTSRAVRWVLVEGATGDGATIDRGTFDLTEAVDPDDLLDVLLIDEADNRMHAIGLTWTNEAEGAASGVLAALTARDYDNVIAVSELEAGDVLAAGIAGMADYDDVAVCIVEPDAAVVALVTSEGVTVDRIARPLDGADVVELPSSVMAMLELDNWLPDAIFVVGSAEDLDLITTTLDAVTDSPVISAAEADLALAGAPRGVRPRSERPGQRGLAQADADRRAGIGPRRGGGDVRRVAGGRSRSDPGTRRGSRPAAGREHRTHGARAGLTGGQGDEGVEPRRVTARGASRRRADHGRGRSACTRGRARPARLRAARLRTACTSTGLYPARPAGVRAAGRAAAATARPDHRAHPDHQPVSRTGVPAAALALRDRPQGRRPGSGDRRAACK